MYPREKLFTFGREVLSDAELLAILLRTGSRGQPVIDQARKLLTHFGSLGAIDGAPLRALLNVPGIGPAKCSALIAAFELARRLFQAPVRLDQPICDSEDVYARYRHLGFGDVETLTVLALDARNRVIHQFQAAKGSLTGCAFQPRDLFAPLIRLPAHAAILIHNHPSGDPTPSEADIVLTTRVRQAGEILGIRLLDHLVISSCDYRSLRDLGEL